MIWFWCGNANIQIIQELHRHKKMGIFFICQKPQQILTLNVEHSLRTQTSTTNHHYLNKVRRAKYYSPVLDTTDR